jgi:hypothetical protein
MAPNRDVWLATDEQERIDAVLKSHRLARIELPNKQLHASVHSIVENQLAEKVASVVEAMPRLMKEGLTRHEAVHALDMELLYM